MATEQKQLDASGKHLLHSPFTFWYNKRQSGTVAYEQNIKKLADVATVEDFWASYAYLVRPNDIPQGTDLEVFRKGIIPLWEDNANRHGGKWVVRIKKGFANRLWEDALLAILGDEFGLDDEICGIVLSTKFKEDTLSFWNKTASDKAIVYKIRDVIKKVLGITNNSVLEYRAHNEAIKNNLERRVT